MDYVEHGRGVCRSAVKIMVHLQVTLNALEFFAVRANINFTTTLPYDRLCGLVVRVSGYRYRGPGFDSRRYQIF